MLMVNWALAELIGSSPEALQGSSVDAVVHPDDLPAARAPFSDLLAGRRPGYRITNRYVRPDGRMVWGDLRVTLLPSAPGTPPVPLAMIEDVTELHLAQERRQALEATLAAYTAHLEELLDLVNLSLPPEEQVLALLRLAQRALGMDRASLESMPGRRPMLDVVARSDDLAAPPPALPPRLLDAALAQPGRPVTCCDDAWGAEAAAAGRGCCIVLAVTDTGGEEEPEPLLLVLWGRQRSIQLTDPLRQLLRLTAQRITAVRAQQRMQQDLVQAKERETIGHLTSGVAHDFNNLLGVIDANLFFIEAAVADFDVDDAELGQVLEETRSALSQAKVVTSGMLSLSRAGGVPLAIVPLEESIEELLGILRHVLPQAIVLEADIPPDLAAWTNSAFLQAALLNLALNARDAMPAGGHLRIAAAPRQWDGRGELGVGYLSAGEYVEVSVTDTGSGISPQAMARIFEPLFSTKAKGRGHGLGLFMVKEFVLRSGAGLAVSSEQRQGTRFRLLLPARPATPPGGDATPPATITALTGGDAPAPRSLAGLRVLVVDDDPRVRDAIGRLLVLQGIATVFAEHGEAALAQLRDEPGVDLVLTDMAMPVMDGPTLRARLREEHPGLPVLMMTGQENLAVSDGHHGDNPPALRKPVEPAELRAAIQALCFGRPHNGGD
jgi:PAS domain S-box-containing protein